MDFTNPVQAIIPGAQGRILAVLMEATAELNLRTVARLAGVSVAQASRVLPHLVGLGLVQRREAPPSALFILTRSHAAAEPLLRLARIRDIVIDTPSRIADELPVAPVSVIAFGSFARGDAEPESDIDTVLVRPLDVAPEDPDWLSSIDQWIAHVGELTGNRVEVLEVGSDEVAERLGGRRSVWRDIRRDGLVVFGAGLDDLAEVANAQ